VQRADRKRADYYESNEYPYDCSIHSANGKEPMHSSNMTGSSIKTSDSMALFSGSGIYTVFLKLLMIYDVE
jgi:uncharacterized membrane protein